MDIDLTKRNDTEGCLMEDRLVCYRYCFARRWIQLRFEAWPVTGFVTEN